jgi:hypothetical protein
MNHIGRSTVDLAIRLSNGSREVRVSLLADLQTYRDRLVRFKPIADGEFHTYKLDVSAHPKWKGQTITGLRLDPLRGTPKANVEIDFIRASAD